MFKPPISFFLSAIALTLAAGCSDTADVASAAKASAASEEHARDHPSEGPHHGHLIELGNEEFHAELLHDKSTVTIYLLDSSAKNPVAIEAAELVINLKHDGKPEQYKLAASPDADDEAGKSSRFMSEDATLVALLDDEAAEPKLSVTIDGTPYTGSLSHDHDHDHAH